MRRRVPTPTLALAAALAIACGPPDVVTRVDAYYDEVREALGNGGPPTPALASERFLPGLRERRVEVGDQRIGMFDFLAIQGCRLGVLAGYRNSPLGRVMVPTRRLVYEVEVLDAANACLEGLEGERRERLAALIARKRAELGRHVWNAVWTDSELDAYLGSEQPPTAEEWDDFALYALLETARAIESVGPGEAALPTGAVDAANEVEAALGELRSARPGGGLLRALDAVGRRMEDVAILLERHPSDDCSGATRRLAGVFQATYVNLQGELARLDGRGRELVESLGQLYRESSAGVEVPPSMRRYSEERLDMQAEGALWPRYRRAVQRHAAAWERPLSVCDVLPAA